MKKRIRLIVAILAVTGGSALISCSRDSTRSFADKFIEAENKAWSTGSLEDLKALEHTNVVYHLPGNDLVGWKAHEDFILQGRPTVSNLRQTWKYLSGEGNHFALSYDSSALVRGNGTDLSMEVSNSYLFVFRLEDGRIAEVWTNGTTTSKPTEAR